MVDWSLVARKKWLFLGDSNLARLPTFSILDLQIESYPGANFHHAEAVLAKSVTYTVVEKVLLSFGLNCRQQKAKETAIKQLQGAFRMTKKQFPHAEIWVPLINYSACLPHEEQVTIRKINEHIKQHLPYIAALRSSDFQTEKDHIHWTKKTASTMLDHWIAYLNLISP